jgi:dynein heavy chain
VPIDQLSFGFRVLNDSPTDPPETGVYIEGLYLEAASWNKVNSSLDEALPN